MMQGIDKKGWTKVAFGDVCRNLNITESDPLANGIDRYVGLEHIEPGKLHITSWGNVADGTTFTKTFKPGHVLFGKRRAYQKKAAVADFAGLCSGDILVLAANEKAIHPRFFPFLVSSDVFFDFAVQTSAGSLSPRTKFQDLAQFQFLLPPKDQQALLAELLWAGDAVVGKLKHLEDSILHLKTSLFREFYRTYSTSNSTEVKDLLVDGPRNGYSPNPNSEGVGYKTVSIGAIQNGLFLPEGNLKYAVAESTVVDHFGLRSGDILIVRGNGNRNLCGKAGLVTEDFTDMFYPDLLIRLRFDQGKLLPEFVSFQWNQPEIHSKLLQWAKSTNGIYKINGQDINRHTLIVPPLSIQKQIVQKLKVINNCVTLAQNDHHKTTLLRKFLLNQIFTS